MMFEDTQEGMRIEQDNKIYKLWRQTVDYQQIVDQQVVEIRRLQTRIGELKTAIQPILHNRYFWENETGNTIIYAYVREDELIKIGTPIIMAGDLQELQVALKGENDV